MGGLVAARPERPHLPSNERSQISVIGHPLYHSVDSRHRSPAISRRMPSYDIGQQNYGRSNLSDSNICLVSMDLRLVSSPLLSFRGVSHPGYGYFLSRGNH